MWWNGVQMAASHAITRADLDLFLVTDDLEAAMQHLRVHAIERFGLHARRVPRPSRWLGESQLGARTRPSP